MRLHRIPGHPALKDDTLLMGRALNAGHASARNNLEKVGKSGRARDV